MKAYPNGETVEVLLKEGESRNPGPWGNHSRYAALCAEKIAAACGMDSGTVCQLLFSFSYDQGRGAEEVPVFS